MQTILRTRPENLDDITMQVALVRPGPIQGEGGAPVHRAPAEAARGPDVRAARRPPLLAQPLRETLGVIVFQDQVLDVAIHLAGFTVGEAEGLRRAMSRKRSHAALEAYRDALHRRRAREGMSTSGRARVYDKLVAFSGFGFPKSHSAAFGLLAYQSAWLRHHYSAEFLAALLNAQPMGFYPPATLVRDAQRRDVETRPPDVNRSGVDCDDRGRRRRIGLKYVQGVGEDDAEAIVGERDANGPYTSIRELAQRTPLSKDELGALVESGACDSFGLKRRELLWQLGLVPRPTSVPGRAERRSSSRCRSSRRSTTPDLPEPTVWERMLADYRTTSLSVGVHPLELMRPHLPDGTHQLERMHADREARRPVVVEHPLPDRRLGQVGCCERLPRAEARAASPRRPSRAPSSAAGRGRAATAAHGASGRRSRRRRTRRAQ